MCLSVTLVASLTLVSAATGHGWQLASPEGLAEQRLLQTRGLANVEHLLARHGLLGQSTGGLFDEFNRRLAELVETNSSLRVAEEDAGESAEKAMMLMSRFKERKAFRSWLVDRCYQIQSFSSIVRVAIKRGRAKWYNRLCGANTRTDAAIETLITDKNLKPIEMYYFLADSGEAWKGFFVNLTLVKVGRRANEKYRTFLVERVNQIPRVVGVPLWAREACLAYDGQMEEVCEGVLQEYEFVRRWVGDDTTIRENVDKLEQWVEMHAQSISPETPLSYELDFGKEGANVGTIERRTLKTLHDIQVGHEWPALARILRRVGDWKGDRADWLKDEIAVVKSKTLATFLESARRVWQRWLAAGGTYDEIVKNRFMFVSGRFVGRLVRDDQVRITYNLLFSFLGMPAVGILQFIREHRCLNANLSSDSVCPICDTQLDLSSTTGDIDERFLVRLGCGSTAENAVGHVVCSECAEFTFRSIGHCQTLRCLFCRTLVFP